MQMKPLESICLHAERNAESRDGLVPHSIKFLCDALDERVALEPVRSKRQMRAVIFNRTKRKDNRIALFLAFRQFDRRHIEQRLRPLYFIQLLPVANITHCTASSDFFARPGTTCRIQGISAHNYPILKNQYFNY